MYAFKPITTGWPSTTAAVARLPPLLATINVLPLLLGLGGSFTGIRTTNSPFSIVACMSRTSKKNASPVSWVATLGWKTDKAYCVAQNSRVAT